MNSAELESFLCVATTGSISAAARQLHLSQPALTRRIQNLEADLGTALFDRVGKRLQLNSAGRTLLPRVRGMLDTWQDTQRELGRLSSEVGGTLGLATSHHIGLHRLAPVLADYRKQFPQVQLNIQFEDSEVAQEMVRDGRIELTVATLAPDPAQDLQSEPVWHDPLAFVARSGGAFSMADLARQPCVLPGSGTYTGRIVVNAFRERGHSLIPAMSTNYLETIQMLVGVGLGWSVLPMTMTENLAVLQVDCPPLARTLGLVTNPQRAISNAAAAFVDVLRQHADS